ncbi:13122_t:CDS:2 [Gigaspora rosea]|nr:13122_t:CDS:2 [Gigaspora rosea]
MAETPEMVLDNVQKHSCFRHQSWHLKNQSNVVGKLAGTENIINPKELDDGGIKLCTEKSIVRKLYQENKVVVAFGQTTPESQRLQQGLKEIIIAEGNPHNSIRLAEIFLQLEQLLKCNQPCYRTPL